MRHHNFERFKFNIEPRSKWVGRRSGAVIRVLDFGPTGPWFEPRPVHISLWP